MRRRAAVVLSLACTFGSLTLAGPVQALAPASPADKPPTVGDDDLAAANRAVGQAAGVLAISRAQLGPARAALAGADALVAASRSNAAAAGARAAAAAVAQTAAAGRLRTTQAALAGAQHEIGSLARTIYMQGPYSELQLVLTATDPGDFADRLSAVRSVVRSYDHSLRDLAVARADVALRSAQADAAAGRAAIEQAGVQQSVITATAARTTAATAKARVDSLVAERARALRVAQNQQAEVAAQYRAYRDYQRQVAEQMRRAAAAARKAATTRPGVGSAGPAPSGGAGPSAGAGLVWPVAGAATSGGVGWRVHPVYGYRSCHTGTDIRGWAGTPILAAASGVVASVVNSGAYGLHTIISHSGGLATMYAHQSRAAVSPGQRVRAGQVIGYVGSSGWVTGPHLHFEVHVNGVPYDPMGWFGGSKHPVPCWNG